MKRLLMLLCWFGIVYPLNTPPYIKGHSTFCIRSQSTNGARKCVATHPQMRHHRKKHAHGFLTITPSYSHSMRSGRIALALWGSESFDISGSNVLNRNHNDLLADYFGLSDQFFSTVRFKPTIQTAQCSFDSYTCLDNVAHGLYFRVYAPFVWTKWDMDIAEDVKQSGIGALYPAGYTDVGPVVAPRTSFRDALRGTTRFGQMQDPLEYGIVDKAHTKSGFSDLQLILGYDILRSWRGHFGIFGFLGCPTGTRRRSHILFEPQIGNDKHWEPGAGFIGYATLWEKDERYELGFYGDMTISHLCSTRQRRSFDIKTNRNLSRYMLIKEFDVDKNYTGSMAPLINKTTLDCNVYINLQFDIVAMLTFSTNHIVCDAGYNGWIRTKERISLAECFANNRYGLKGIQNVVILPNTFSSATQSSATIYGNEFLIPTDQSALTDNPSPKLLTTEDLDLRSAASTYLMTHKLFINAAYVWKEKYPINPLLSIGGEIEFEGTNPDKTVQQYRHTLSLWSLWIKSGIVF